MFCAQNPKVCEGTVFVKISDSLVKVSHQFYCVLVQRICVV